MDGSRVLRLGGADDNKKEGRLGKKCPAAFERFRGMEVDFVLEYMLEDLKLRPSQWDKKRKETFQPVTWHWEHANAEYSSWVRPGVKVPESGSTDGWVVRRFRACIEPDDSLVKAGFELRATCAAGGAMYVRDFRIEAAKDAFMDRVVEKADFGIIVA